MNYKYELILSKLNHLNLDGLWTRTCKTVEYFIIIFEKRSENLHENHEFSGDFVTVLCNLCGQWDFSIEK